jgi:hypothetical protein
MIRGKAKIPIMRTRATVSNGVIFLQRGKKKYQNHKPGEIKRELKYIQERKNFAEAPSGKKF